MKKCSIEYFLFSDGGIQKTPNVTNREGAVLISESEFVALIEERERLTNETNDDA